MKRRKLLSASSVLYVSATKIVIIFRTYHLYRNKFYY